MTQSSHSTSPLQAPWFKRRVTRWLLIRALGPLGTAAVTEAGLEAMGGSHRLLAWLTVGAGVALSSYVVRRGLRRFPSLRIARRVDLRDRLASLPLDPETKREWLRDFDLAPKDRLDEAQAILDLAEAESQDRPWRAEQHPIHR
jgi:hypothetical protein